MQQLTLTKTLKQRRDWKRWVEETQLSSYLFVKVSKREYYNILNITEDVFCFSDQAVPILDNQIHTLKNFVRQKSDHLAIHYGDMAERDMMEIMEGPLKGICDEATKIRGSHRVILRFASLNLCAHAKIFLNEIKNLKINQLLAS